MQSGSDLAVLLVDRELRAGGISALSLIYDKTFVALAPIIGARGVCEIFKRALELVQAEQAHPALRSFVVGDEPNAAASTLAISLGGMQDAGRAAAVALYSAFFSLIVTFVGFELTVRLLRNAWPEVDFKETQ
jgi:hypothetical protein